MSKTFINNFNDKRTKTDYTFFPIGSVIQFGGGSAPIGFLLCDGSAVSRTTYADLFDVIGTRFGKGNGSTTFNLPNMSDKVARGTSTSTSVGGSGGADSVTLAVKNLPSHSHGLNSHTHTLTHTHELTPSGSISGGSYSFSGTTSQTTLPKEDTDGYPSLSLTGHSPYIQMDYGYKDGLLTDKLTNDGIFDSVETRNGTTDSGDGHDVTIRLHIDAQHVHTFTPNGTVSIVTNPSFSGDLNETSSQSESTTSQASGDTTSVGEGTAFNIIPSYINFYYIIKY